MPVQLLPLPESLLNLPGRNSTAEVDLAFMAVDIPPLGYMQFHVQKVNSSKLLAQQMSRVYIPKPPKEIHWLKQKNGVSYSIATDSWYSIQYMGGISTPPFCLVARFSYSHNSLPCSLLVLSNFMDLSYIMLVLFCFFRT